METTHSFRLFDKLAEMREKALEAGGEERKKRQHEQEMRELVMYDEQGS